MRCILRQSTLLGAAVAATVLCGCTSQPDTAHTYPGRSMVFDTPQLMQGLRELASDHLESAGTLPWYAVRNDYQPTTYAGYHGERSDWSVNRTYDRQTHTPGRVRDYYRSRTITQRAARIDN